MFFVNCIRRKAGIFSLFFFSLSPPFFFLHTLIKPLETIIIYHICVFMSHQCTNSFSSKVARNILLSFVFSPSFSFFFFPPLLPSSFFSNNRNYCRLTLYCTSQNYTKYIPNSQAQLFSFFVFFFSLFFFFFFLFFSFLFRSIPFQAPLSWN